MVSTLRRIIAVVLGLVLAFPSQPLLASTGDTLRHSLNFTQQALVPPAIPFGRMNRAVRGLLSRWTQVWPTRTAAASSQATTIPDPFAYSLPLLAELTKRPHPADAKLPSLKEMRQEWNRIRFNLYDSKEQARIAHTEFVVKLLPFRMRLRSRKLWSKFINDVSVAREIIPSKAGEKWVMADIPRPTKRAPEPVAVVKSPEPTPHRMRWQPIAAASVLILLVTGLAYAGGVQLLRPMETIPAKEILFVILGATVVGWSFIHYRRQRAFDAIPTHVAMERLVGASARRPIPSIANWSPSGTGASARPKPEDEFIRAKEKFFAQLEKLAAQASALEAPKYRDFYLFRTEMRNEINRMEYAWSNRFYSRADKARAKALFHATLVHLYGQLAEHERRTIRLTGDAPPQSMVEAVFLNVPKGFLLDQKLKWTAGPSSSLMPLRRSLQSSS